MFSNRVKMKMRAAALVVSMLGMAPAVQGVQVEDVLGRQVEVPDQVQRVVLGEGRLFYAMAVLDKEAPFKRIAGWQNDLRLSDPTTFEGYVRQFPEAASIPLIGQSSEQSVSVERILDLKPDLAIFSISGHGPTQHSPIAEVLEKAGVPVVFVDFRVKPVEGTQRSFRMLGKALNREAQANAFLEFYETHLARVTQKLTDLSETQRPKVFIELLAGVWQAPGHTTGNGGMGDFISLAGGRNIAAGVVPGAIGDVSVEYVLEQNPDVYVISGNRMPGLLLGAQVMPEQARQTLASVLERPEFAPLPAVRNGRAHGIWHEFYNSPYNILAIEVLAKWLHPELFADLDPRRTQQELYERFLPMADGGTYWVDAP